MFEVLYHSLEKLVQRLNIELDTCLRHAEDEMAYASSHDLSSLAFVEAIFLNAGNNSLDTVSNITTFGNGFIPDAWDPAAANVGGPKRLPRGVGKPA